MGEGRSTHDLERHLERCGLCKRDEKIALGKVFRTDAQHIIRTPS